MPDELVPYTNPLPSLWYGAAPELAPDETFLRSYPANRMQGSRAVGGGLHLTTHRMLFRPNAIDARLGGKPWECTRESITSIGVEPRQRSFWALFTAARIDRLRIDLGAQVELFVVRDAAARAAELNELLGGEVPPPANLPEARTIKR